MVALLSVTGGLTMGRELGFNVGSIIFDAQQIGCRILGM